MKKENLFGLLALLVCAFIAYVIIYSEPEEIPQDPEKQKPILYEYEIMTKEDTVIVSSSSALNIPGVETDKVQIENVTDVRLKKLYYPISDAN